MCIRDRSSGELNVVDCHYTNNTSSTVTVNAYFTGTVTASSQSVIYMLFYRQNSTVSVNTMNVQETTVSAAGSTFSTTQLLSLAAGQTIYEIRIIPPGTPGSLQTTVGVTGGTSTDVTLTTDSDLSSTGMIIIPCHYKNAGSSAALINAYFTGTVGASGQSVTYMVFYH